MKIKKSPLVVAGFLSQLLSTETQAEQISQHLDTLDSQNQKQSELINRIDATSFNKNLSNVARTAYYKGPSTTEQTTKNALYT